MFQIRRQDEFSPLPRCRRFCLSIKAGTIVAPMRNVQLRLSRHRLGSIPSRIALHSASQRRGRRLRSHTTCGLQKSKVSIWNKLNCSTKKNCGEWWIKMCLGFAEKQSRRYFNHQLRMQTWLGSENTNTTMWSLLSYLQTCRALPFSCTCADKRRTPADN